MARGSIQERTGTGGTACRVRVEYPLDATTGKCRQRSETSKIKRGAEAALAK